MDKWLPTHQHVANLLGLTVASVSRIRTGNRLPSLEVMTKIRDLLDWSIDDQTAARDADRYATEFNDRLERHAARILTCAG